MIFKHLRSRGDNPHFQPINLETTAIGRTKMRTERAKNKRFHFSKGCFIIKNYITKENVKNYIKIIKE